jgi:hypothetical protein
MEGQTKQNKSGLETELEGRKTNPFIDFHTLRGSKKVVMIFDDAIDQELDLIYKKGVMSTVEAIGYREKPFESHEQYDHGRDWIVSEGILQVPGDGIYFLRNCPCPDLNQSISEEEIKRIRQKAIDDDAKPLLEKEVYYVKKVKGNVKNISLWLSKGADKELEFVLNEKDIEKPTFYQFKWDSYEHRLPDEKVFDHVRYEHYDNGMGSEGDEQIPVYRYIEHSERIVYLKLVSSVRNQQMGLVFNRNEENEILDFVNDTYRSRRRNKPKTILVHEEIGRTPFEGPWGFVTGGDPIYSPVVETPFEEVYPNKDLREIPSETFRKKEIWRKKND